MLKYISLPSFVQINVNCSYKLILSYLNTELVNVLFYFIIDNKIETNHVTTSINPLNVTTNTTP